VWSSRGWTARRLVKSQTGQLPDDAANKKTTAHSVEFHRQHQQLHVHKAKEQNIHSECLIICKLPTETTAKYYCWTVGSNIHELTSPRVDWSTICIVHVLSSPQVGISASCPVTGHVLTSLMTLCGEL